MAPIDVQEFQKVKYIMEANNPDQPTTYQVKDSEHADNDNNETSDNFDKGFIPEVIINESVIITGAVTSNKNCGRKSTK